MDWADTHAKFDKRQPNADWPRNSNANFRKFEKPANNLRFRLPAHVPKSAFSKILIIGTVLLILEYFFLVEYFAATFYVLETIAAFFIIFKIFRRVERMNISSDLHLFGLKILSGIVAIVGVFLILWGMGVVTFSIFLRSASQIQMTYAIAIFIASIGFGMLALSAFLIFKFKRKSGLIVWRGA